MTVKQITDPQALLRPEVQEILRSAVESGVLLAPYGWDTVAPDLIEFAVNPDHFMVLATEGGRFAACALGYFNTSNLFPYPTIVMYHTKGKVTAATRRALSDKLLDIIVSRGYTSALALNGSGHPDAVWIRGLAPKGVTGEVVGSLVKLTVD